MKTFSFLTLLFFVLFTSCCDKYNTQSEIRTQEQLKTDSILRRSKDINLLKEIDSLCIAQNDMRGEYLAAYNIGKCLRETGGFEEAINYHNRALHLAQSLADTTELINVLNQLGTNHRRVGNLTEASECLFQATHLYNNYSNPDDPKTKLYYTSVLNGLGNVQKEMNHSQDALEFFKKALEYEIESNNFRGQAINYSNIASIMHESGRRDSALYYYNLSLDYNTRINSTIGIALCRIAFGNIYDKEKQYGMALREYQAAYKLMENTKDRWHWLISCLAVAKVNMKLNNLREAADYLNKGEAAAQQMQSNRSLKSVYDLKWQYEENIGNLDEAQKYFKLAIQYEDSIRNESSNNAIQSMRLNLEREQAKIADRIAQSEKQSQRQRYYIYILSVVLLGAIIITMLLYHNYLIRKRNLIALNEKNKELEHMNFTLQKMHKDLEDSVNTHILFLQNITHEIRTPLNAISGFSQALTGDIKLSDEERSLCTSQIMTNTDLLTRLVADLCMLGNLVNGEIACNPMPFDLTDCVKRISDEHRSQLPMKVKLDLHVPDHPLDVRTDGTHLGSILDRLLDMACKNTIEGDITLRLTAEDQFARIRISDTGCCATDGMIRALNENSTIETDERFKQGTDATLIICKRLAQSIKSQLYIDPTYTRGTCFVLELPL